MISSFTVFCLGATRRFDESTRSCANTDYSAKILIRVVRFQNICVYT